MLHPSVLLVLMVLDAENLGTADADWETWLDVEELNNIGMLS